MTDHVKTDDAGNALKVIWSDANNDGKLETYTIWAVNPTYDANDPATGDQYIAPVFDEADANGTEYEYEVVEINHPGYNVSYDTDPNRYIINNLLTNTSTKTDSLKVTKTWDDAQNAEGLRPDKVIMHLYKEISVSLTDEEKAAAAATVNKADYDTNGTPGYSTEEEAAYYNAVNEAINSALEAKKAAESPVQVEVTRKEITKQTGDTDDVWSTGVEWNDLPVYDETGQKIHKLQGSGCCIGLYRSRQQHRAGRKCNPCSYSGRSGSGKAS